MRPRFFALCLVTTLLLPGAFVAPPAHAQQWNDPRTLELLERATERRALQLADTLLHDYQARAHGYLTFLAQIGAGFPEPPRIIKADELALDVYWRAPNLSKQLIVGRRDTLLLPTDIQYHRDHLGIVQGNFPDIIRLGEGDEVEDVPHPVSLSGMQLYDFAISDSLQLRLGPRTIDVLEVRLRPRDQRAPRAVGAVYIERENADVVRMALGFTRAALKDRSLEDLSVVLENALVHGRFWLPHRQEIEIRRTGTWLDYPVRTIIRGRWEICCHAVNIGIDPQFFTGPEIVLAQPAAAADGDTVTSPFTGTILEALRDETSPLSDVEVRRVQDEARALVRAQALARAPTPALAARRVSDFVRYNRVEGLALGAGVGQRVGLGFAAIVHARYGFADERWKGGGELSFTRANGLSVAARWRDAHAEAGDVAEVSLLRNSFAAQSFGSDYTDPYAVRGASFEFGAPTPYGRLVFTLASERHGGLEVNAIPARGRFAPTLPVFDARVRQFGVRLDQPTQLFGENTRFRYAAGLGVFRYAQRLPDCVPRAVLPPCPDFPGIATYGRGSFDAHLQRDLGAGRALVVEGFAAIVGGGAAPQHHVLLGGPVSAPGYDYHSLTGTRGGFVRTELRSGIPFPTIPLGRFGRTPARATVAPFAHLAWVGWPAGFPAGRAGAFPSIGVGLMPFFELLRLDVARGLRDGRWSLYLDITRDFWPVL